MLDEVLDYVNCLGFEAVRNENIIVTESDMIKESNVSY